MKRLIETCRLDIFCFFPFILNTIHSFYFQLVEKFEHVQTFQLNEINFRFVENNRIFIITLTQLVDFKKSNSIKSSVRGGSSVRPLMQMAKSYFLPMEC